MQPSATPADGTSVRVVKGAHDDVATVNEEAFWSKNVHNVPVDQARISLFLSSQCAGDKIKRLSCFMFLQVFFHKYFAQKNRKEKEKAGKVSKRKGADTAAAEQASEVDEKSQADGEDEDDEDDAEEAEIWKVIVLLQFSRRIKLRRF